MSPSSIRYPLQAPPASCHDGDLPSTVIRIVTINSISATPRAAAVPAPCAPAGEPWQGRARQAVFGAAGSLRAAARSRSAGWRGGTRPSALFGPEGGAGLVEVERAEHLAVEEAVLAARASLAPLGCSALGQPDRLAPSAWPDARSGSLSTPLALPAGARRSSALAAALRAATHLRNPRLFEKWPAAGFPAFADRPARGYNSGRWRTSAPRGCAPRRRCSRTAFLDFFSRIHPSVPAIIFVPVVVAGVWLGADRGYGAVELVLLVALGLLIWTLTEYWLHRLVFHWEPDHPLGSRLHFIIHGVHHDHPNDRLRLVMPPAVSMPLAALFFLGLHADLRNPGRLPDLRRPDRRLPRLRLHPLSPAPSHARRRSSASACGSSTCATTSRITATATASPPRSGTSSSAPCRASATSSAPAVGYHSPPSKFRL